jgi:uracil-DNA glycosylase family 4
LLCVEASIMADELNDESERRSLIRSLRQQLESLARAGLSAVPTALEPSGSVDLPGVFTAPESVQMSAEPRATKSADVEKHETVPGVEQPPPAPLTIADTITPAPASQPPANALPPPSLAELFHSSEFERPPVPACDRPALLEALAREVAGCRRCPHLADTRTQTVFGVGPPVTRLMFIGEAPGADEDRLGEPFVGRAGQLLNDMITKGMGLSRSEVYIANILKCRPPENRTPTTDESNNCFPYLEKQIEIIRPEFICLLGRPAVQAILNTTLSMARVRGKWHRYRGIPTIATYHPAYLLRNPAAKKDSWDDLRILMKEMGLKVGGRQ